MKGEHFPEEFVRVHTSESFPPVSDEATSQVVLINHELPETAVC